MKHSHMHMALETVTTTPFSIF